MARKSKKQDASSADGAHLPSHEDLNAHVDMVLLGIDELGEKFPSQIPSLSSYSTHIRGAGTTVSPFLDSLAEILKGIVTEMTRLYKIGENYTPKGDVRTLAKVMPGRRSFQFLRLIYRCWKKDQAKTKALFKMLETGYKRGVHYTTNEFKVAAPSYIKRNWNPATVSIKTLRGFNDDDFGRALVPIQHRGEYDQDPGAFRTRILNGEIIITENDLPSMLFSDDLVYDPEDPASGIGTGAVFLKFLNHELIGSSGAFGEKSKATKASKAIMWNVEKITPNIVASVTVQAWVACSSMSQFGHEDGTVDLAALHENIVEILRISDEDTEAIFEALHQNVPHLHTAPTGRRRVPSTKAKPDRVNIAEHVKEKRRQKRLAAANAAPGAEEGGGARETTPMPDMDDDGFDLDDDDPAAKGQGVQGDFEESESDTSTDDSSSENEDSDTESSEDGGSPLPQKTKHSRDGYTQGSSKRKGHGKENRDPNPSKRKAGRGDDSDNAFAENGHSKKKHRSDGGHAKRGDKHKKSSGRTR